MQEVPNQAEIDAMARAKRGGASNRSAIAPTAMPWDIRVAGQIGREQMNAINLLHQSFARNLTHSIGAYLRIEFEAGLVSAEHLAYRAFLRRMPESTYIASCRVAPAGVTALLQVDFSLAFPMIDLLLGGDAAGNIPQRDLTEIEEQILENLVRIVLRELQASWQALAIEFHFEQRQPGSQVHRLMPPEEKTLCLSFEIKMLNTRGTLNLAMPAVISNALLRKISADCLSAALVASLRPPAVSATSAPAPHEEQGLDSFLNVQLAVTLRFGTRQMLLRDVLELNAGAVVELDRKVQAPVDLLLYGRVIGRGEVVVVDGNYGLRMTEVGSGPTVAE